MKYVITVVGIFMLMGIRKSETKEVLDCRNFAYKELERYKIRLPMIVVAQMAHETGIFKSKVFKENHNPFGMKHNSRGYSLSTKNGHAFYPHTKHLGHCTWNCYSYAFRDYKEWQDRFVPDTISTAESYLIALQKKGYAEDPKYIERVLPYYYILKQK